MAFQRRKLFLSNLTGVNRSDEVLEFERRNGCILEVASIGITEELADELDELLAIDQ